MATRTTTQYVCDGCETEKTAGELRRVDVKVRKMNAGGNYDGEAIEDAEVVE